MSIVRKELGDILKAAKDAHRNPAPPLAGPQRYKWFKAKGKGQINNPGPTFWILIGCDSTTLIAAAFAAGRFEVLSVLDSTADVIDAITLHMFQSSAVGIAAAVLTLPRKMLIPPGGSLQPNDSTSTNIFSLVNCATEEDAILLLKG